MGHFSVLYALHISAQFMDIHSILLPATNDAPAPPIKH